MGDSTMFGSNILDVAIGMIFVYLLLSLICSAANEIIEGWLKHRSTDLEKAIREMLVPNSGVSGTGIVADLYNHPLINGLFKGTYDQFVQYRAKSKVARFFASVFNHNASQLPSYIPARSFALALMDTVLPASSSKTPAATDANGAVIGLPPVDTASGASGAPQLAASIAPLVAIAPPAAAGAAAPAVVVAPRPPSPAGPNPLQDLRDASGRVPNPQTRRALLALIDAAGADVDKARENIEVWFNTSMDRVSGWYKRRTQIIIFVLGLMVVIATNADSVALVKGLSTDKAMRDALVASAQAYAKENAPAAPVAPVTTGAPAAPAAPVQPKTDAASSSNTNDHPSPAPAASTSGTGIESNASSSTVPAASNVDPSNTANANRLPAPATKKTTGAPTTAATDPPECADDKNSPDCRIAKNLRLIQKQDLPIGWVDASDEPDRNWPGTNFWGKPGSWLHQAWVHWIGWLLTALAISLGAPFWFDMLSKFITVRSTLKPKDSVPDPGSKP
jgi:hypothetical protein